MRLTSALIDGFFFGSANLFFCLEPVVELRAGFVPVLDVEFVGAALDSFFEGEPFLKAFFCRCRCCHWDHLWLEGIIGVRQSEAPLIGQDSGPGVTVPPDGTPPPGS